MDNTKNALIAQRLRSFAESQWMDFDAPDSAAMLNKAADALEAAVAAHAEVSRDLVWNIDRANTWQARAEAAEAELTRRVTVIDTIRRELHAREYIETEDCENDVQNILNAIQAALDAAPVSLEAPTPEQFEQQVFAERERQEVKGYTTEHDREHGIDHLLMWAIEYARRGERVKFAALNVAARELLAAEAMASLEAAHELFPGTLDALSSLTIRKEN